MRLTLDEFLFRQFFTDQNENIERFLAERSKKIENTREKRLFPMPYKEFSLSKIIEIIKNLKYEFVREFSLKGKEVLLKIGPKRKLLSLPDKINFFESKLIRTTYFLKDGSVINVLKDIEIYIPRSCITKRKTKIHFISSPLFEVEKIGHDFNLFIKKFAKMISPSPPLEFFINNIYMNFLGEKSRKKPKLEIPSIEIETKFISKKDEEKTWEKIYDFINKGELRDFIIERNFPYILYRGLIISYINVTEKINIPIPFVMLRIHKSEPFILRKNSINILLRQETKMPIKYYSIKNFLELPFIIKRKKVFWIENIKTSRVYHIAVDKEISKKGELTQIEVEYAGKLESHSSKEPLKNVLDEITKEMFSIAKTLKKRFGLILTTETKGEWLLRKG